MRGFFVFGRIAIRIGKRLWTVFEHYYLAGCGGDAEGIGGAMADKPQDGVGGTKQPRAAFVEQGKFVVVEIVAQLFASFHAERAEAVALSPMAQGEFPAKNFAVEIR